MRKDFCRRMRDRTMNAAHARQMAGNESRPAGRGALDEAVIYTVAGRRSSTRFALPVAVVGNSPESSTRTCVDTPTIVLTRC
ncbi:hypothetical protein AWB79_04736 [Caballeronia hypogeia]|uniref:Uncharacterized protein n=1 Tax=Caballeronia hypogeia TaxID=1777140 RepID=A0A158C510_9BURK|nr:hypothetical protein AWB79_04736 [Caballeronia hypogeia]